MLFPFNVDVPMERIPYANWVLIGVTILVSFAVASGQTDLVDHSLALHRGVDSSPLQLFTYTLVHGGFFHLLGNMIFLFCFGNAINAKFGHVTYLVFYFAAGAVAGLAWLAFGQYGVLVGASGAIMGVTGAFLVLYPKNDVSVFYFVIFAAGTFQITSGLAISVYIGLDVWHLISASATAVAYVAHVAGAAAGFGTAVALLLTRKIQSTRWEQNLLQIWKIQP